MDYGMQQDYGMQGLRIGDCRAELRMSPAQVYKYVFWSITVPLLMIEFNLILKAAQRPETSECLWTLFLGTVVMLAFDYAGEPDPLEAWIGFFRLCTTCTCASTG